MRTAPLALALAASLAAAAPASAHIVSRGIGSQTELEVTPRRIRVKFNLGFAKVLGLTQLTKMDLDKDGVIRPAEQDAYVAALGKKVLPQLRLTLDGERLPLRLIDSQGIGILGRIEQVGFDTWFELVADVSIGAGDHVVTWYDGSYADSEEPSEQLLWVVLGPKGRFAHLDASQEQPSGMPPRPRGRVRGLRGRDATLKLAFSQAALADDAQLETIEPWLTGIEARLHRLRGTLETSLEEELNALAFTAVDFPAERRAATFSEAAGAQMAKQRVIEESTGAVVRTVETPGRGEVDKDAPKTAEEKMIAAARQPFSFLFLALFMLWGAGHALMPGHGKTMVAAYLLGTEGRLSDAFKLGAIVTFTHTIALYTIGLAIVYLVTESPTAFINRTAQRLTLLSGLGLIAYGAYLGRQRIRSLRASGGSDSEAQDPTRAHDHSADRDPSGQGQGQGQGHDSDHSHAHDHSHSHDHASDHDRAHDHDDASDHAHEHDHAHETTSDHSHEDAHGSDPTHSHSHAHSHSHDHSAMTAEEHARAHAAEAASVTSWRDLWVLGVTGGLVPCPAGVVLVIFSLSFKGQNTLKAFVYLSAFSVGLASVLIAIAGTMVLSRRYLLKTPEPGGKYERLLQALPIVSCGAICLVGAFLCWQAFDPRAQMASRALLGF